MASTKSVPSPGGDGSPSLAYQINASITSSHTTLNRLILDRMPRAVPPQTDNPSTYITGLLHIGAVYIAFESLWQNLLGTHSEIAPIPYTFPFSSPDQQQQHHETPQITARTRRVLEQVYSATMLRSPRIKADVQAMTGWPDHVFEQQMKLAGTSGCLGKFTMHIREVVNAKPHLLLAYAYTLYLALLSGGSYIRTELMYLDRKFWEASPSPVLPGSVECRPEKSRRRRRRPRQGDSEEHDEDVDVDEDEDEDEDEVEVEAEDRDEARRLPLDFLDFDPPLGANPRQQTRLLKTDFKERLSAADTLLADPERRDIVAEATLIFQYLEGVVIQLDTLFERPSTAPAKLHAQRALGGVGGRLRDSIAIAKGRLLRTRRKSSGTSIFAAKIPALVDQHAAQAGGVHPEQASGEQDDDLLAREAVVPREGFRTIRYGSDLTKPSRRTAAAAAKTQHGLDAETPHSFDGASDHCCPMSRGPAVKSVGPDYALYAIVSNFVLLGALVGVFIAWLWVRHGEGEVVV